MSAAPLPLEPVDDATPLIAERAHLAATLLAEAAKAGVPTAPSASQSNFESDDYDVELCVFARDFEAWAAWLGATELVRRNGRLVTRAGAKHGCRVHFFASLDGEQLGQWS